MEAGGSAGAAVMVGAAVACGPGWVHAMSRRNKMGYKRFILEGVI
jgi:hypothetical protein